MQPFLCLRVFADGTQPTMLQKIGTGFTVLGISGLAAGLMIGTAGCENHPPDELAKAVYYGEHPVAMRGSDTFFDGKVAAIVTISRGIGRGYAQGGRGKGKASTAPSLNDLDEPDQSHPTKLNELPGNIGGQNAGLNGGSPMGGANAGLPPGANGGQQMPGQTGQGMMGGPGVMNGGAPEMGGGGMGAGYGAGEEQDEDAAKMEQENAIAYLRAKAAIGSPLPPVTLHLQLRNLHSQPVSFEIQTFNSDLGNFAVEPDNVTLAPHQLAEPTPMISQLGVTSDLIPVTITLKLGGKTETKTILVRSLLDPNDVGN
jgi:hypothetical protein